MVDVVAGLLLRNGQALLGLRKPGGRRGGLWEMPGGKVETRNVPGDHGMIELIRERHETALIREWKEELDLDIIVGERITAAVLDLETCFTVTLYAVFSDRVPKPLDHADLMWATLPHAIEYLPCSPALYLHWPVVREWLKRRA